MANKFYQANQDIDTPEEFNISHWDQITLKEITEILNSKINNVEQQIPLFQDVIVQSANVTVAANAISSAITLAPEIPQGYKIFAISAYVVSGSGAGSAVFANGFAMNGTGTEYTTYLYNPTSSAKTWKVTLAIKLIKEGSVG